MTASGRNPESTGAAGGRAELTTIARAKVNLDLRVIGRRADGYHELDSLVAFAGIGDKLALNPAATLGLTIAGPYAAGLGVGDDNLVLRAARVFLRTFPGTRAGAFHLSKKLPVASGIGGGSADAAAALRLLARLNRLPSAIDSLQEIAAGIGADVPVCLDSRARLMTGIGDRLGPVLRLPSLPALLVNPGVPVETVAVFKSLALAAGESRDRHQDRLEAWPTTVPALHCELARSRNDLEAPARRVAPVIGAVLGRLEKLPGCRLARMSGSGATCFALFDDGATSAAATRILAREQPGWWVRSTVLG